MKNQNDIDLELENSYLQLPEIFYTKTRPTRVKDPKLLIFNEDLVNSLGLDMSFFQKSEAIEFLAGNRLIHNSIPISLAYAGHQFGYFTILGDGRAILLGEYCTKKGETYDLQLKGSGKTPYSREGDGRAALGPMLREYIISEAMFALGIPTTRSLALVTTGEQVRRDQLLEGAILTRLAKSHIRVGTFEYAASWGSVEELQKLADYTIQRHDPEVIDQENPYLNFLDRVIDRQAKLIAKWQLVGFVHGVMNTDNMSISGETIDYGPCAFMDVYDPKTVFSSIDREGRYAFGNQPYIGEWNLARFAETLIPLLDEDENQAILLAEAALSKYDEQFKKYFINGMRAKLGLFSEEAQDSLLIGELLSLMNKYKVDYTNTFIALTFGKIDETVLGDNEEFKKWHTNWQDRRKRQGSVEDSFNLMRKNNPAVIPRNHLVEEALAAAVEGGDFGKVEKLLDILANPYAHTEEQVEYQEVPKQRKPYVTFCGT